MTTIVDQTTHLTSPTTITAARFSWGGIIAGLFTAVAINILLAEAWLGVGLMLVDSQSHPGTVIVSSAIAWTISACVALFAGSWVAGRVSASFDRTIGVLHGVGVWATGSVVGLLFAMSAAGAIIGGSAHIVGKGLEAAGSAAAGGVSGAAQMIAPNIDSIRKELDEAMTKRAPGAAAAAETSATSSASIDDNSMANRSRLGELLMGHFTLDEKIKQTDAERAELVALIASESGVSPANATKALEQWDRVWAASVNRWNMAKEQAKVAADQARKLTAQAACWSVIAMALGLMAAAAGGACGVACHRTKVDSRPGHVPTVVV